MTRLLFVAGASLLLFFSGMNFTFAADSAPLAFGGRSYTLHRPAPLPAGKLPLLIVLHGGMGNARFIQSYLGMDSAADAHGFMVAYLNGNPGRRKAAQNNMTWNAGGGCCGPAAKRNSDDVSYIQGFIEDMIANQAVDPDKIYLMGYSNGAMMAYRFACEKPGMVAAMVAISGPLLIDHCHAPELRVLHIHGERDDHVPVAGGIGAESRMRDMNYRSVEETARMMKEAGASFNLKLVPGAGHGMREIASNLRKSDSMALAEIVSRFITGE